VRKIGMPSKEGGETGHKFPPNGDNSGSPTVRVNADRKLLLESLGRTCWNEKKPA